MRTQSTKYVHELHEAARSGDLRAIERLLDSGADIEAKQHGLTPIMTAVGECPGDDVVRLLIARGSNVNVVIGSMSPLIQAGMFGYDGSARILLEAGALPDQQDRKGWTPLMHAASYGLTSTVAVLLEGGASLELASNKGETALDLAAANRHASAADLLMRSGAKAFAANLSGKKREARAAWLEHTAPLLAAAQNGDAARLAELLKDPDSNRDASDPSGDNLLIIAARCGHDSVIGLLLAEGFDVNFESDPGWRPLESAIMSGRVSTVRLLIERGADLSPGHNPHSTPLGHASRDDRLEILELILRFCRDRRLRVDLDTPLKIAQRRGHKHAAQMLRRARSRGPLAWVRGLLGR